MNTSTGVRRLLTFGSYIAVGVAVFIVARIIMNPVPDTGDTATPVTPIGVRYLDSVAVMPLENQTGDPAYDHIGVGIAEEIITNLARIPPLKVISRHSAQAVMQDDLTISSLANALSVRNIIRGVVRRVDDELRVDIEHVVADEDTPVWSTVFAGSPGEQSTFQEDIAREATARFVDTVPGLALPDFNMQGEPGAGQAAYLLGQRRLSERTPEGLTSAITHFQRAIELDPGYAPAYADLASAYALAVFYRYDVGSDAYTLAAQSLAFSNHAIVLDADLAAGYAARGYLGALLGRSADAVASDFERASTLQPNAASIPSWRARSLAQLGQYEEAFAEAARAIDLDPLAPARHIALAELSLQLGRYDQAIASAKMATALEPRISRSRVIEARALLLSGRPQRCVDLQLGPQHRVLRATCLRAAGRARDADEIIESVISAIRTDDLPETGVNSVAVYEDLAVEFALRGDAENSLFWSARAYVESPVGLEIRVLESALFDQVRDEPKFADEIDDIRAGLFDRALRDSETLR